MSINRTSYSGSTGPPKEVTMSVGVRGGEKKSPSPAPPPSAQDEIALARGALSVAGARFYKPSTTPVPGHRWNLQQLRAGEAIVPVQSGTNGFESQRGMRSFGSPRNTTTPARSTNPDLAPSEADLPTEPNAKVGKWTVAQLRQAQGIVIGQAGSNQFASQKGSSGFGSRRDVKGKHLKRIWELEYPEEATADN